jgi:alpha-L-glutamate ligase-like protein
MKILEIWRNRNKVLGQNARNQKYIKRPRSQMGKRIADDKLLTKKLLDEYNIASPKLISTIENHRELLDFEWNSLPDSFVMKPVKGSQGDGIEIFYNRDKEGKWIRGDRSKVDLDEIKRIAQDIIDGMFSLNREADKILFEERIRPHKDLKNYTYKGTPDIRVVVFKGIPIQAYVRFPTKESKGKANMIIGAVGVGIDLATGTTTTAVKGKENGGRGSQIEFVAGSKLRYGGLKIPHWRKILELSVKAQRAVNLDFVAIDFLIDQDNGPFIVEINARPGLSIQLVNQAGLAWRLERVKGIKPKSIEHGIRIAQDLFGGEIEKTIERVSGKEVISNVMPVRLINDKKNIDRIALIDTSRRTTTIDYETAKLIDLVDEPLEDEYLIKDVVLNIGNQTFEASCKIVQSIANGYKVSVGRKDLGGFLIDTRKIDEPKESDLRQKVIDSEPKSKIKEMDEILHRIVKKISVVKMLRPINLTEEKNKFFESKYSYNPQFEYKPLRFDTDNLLSELNNLNPPKTPIGKLYKEKIAEIRKMIFLIESIGQGNDTFTRRSISLFGFPSKKILKIARKITANFVLKKVRNPAKPIDPEIVKARIEKIYNYYNIPVKISFSTKHNKASIGKISGKMYINPNFKWTKQSVDTLIAHEIETHLLKRMNGLEQKYGIFADGTAGYIRTEEGIATIMKRISMQSKIMRISAIKTLAMSYALKHDFVATFTYINKFFNNTKKSWNLTYRLKRGIANTSEIGVCTKDQYFGWAIDTAKEIYDLKMKDLKFIFNGKANIIELLKHTENTSRNYPKLELEDIEKFLVANKVLEV